MTDERYGGQVPPPPPSVPVPELWQAPPPTMAAQADSLTRQLPARRVPRWIVAVAAATAVGSVAAFTFGLVWPFGRGHVPAGPLSFHGFAHVAQVPYDQPSNTALTAVQGDRAYVGWEQDSNLRVVAVDLATGQERWRTTVSGAPRWGRLIASPDVLLVLAHETSTSTPRRLFARDPASGDERWDINVRGEDRLFFTDRTLGWLDSEGGALHGLDLVTGDQRWVERFEGPAQVMRVTTPVALAQPTDRSGQSGPVGDDRRMVLVTADRTVKVLDGYDGGVISERANVAHPRDLLLAYEDHLYVVQEQAGYRVDTYSLANLAEPSRTIYSAADLDRFPEALEPCGGGRVCLLDTLSFDGQSTEVSAVKVADGSVAWRQAVPGAERLLPVGDWVAVATREGIEPHVVVLDSTGEQRHAELGAAARLNDGNFIVVDPQLRGATGFAIAPGRATALGPLPDFLADDCAWNDRHIICVGRDAAQIWRFAND